MVHDPARSADDKVGALLELEDLLLHRSAAIDSHDLDALLVPGELLHLSGGLHGQLPGGTERQHLDALEVGIDHLNGGQAKGCGLAGTGMGTSDHILPLQDQRDALGLDGGRLGVADFGYGTLDGFGQRKITECNAHNTSFWTVPRRGPLPQSLPAGGKLGSFPGSKKVRSQFVELLT